MITELYDRIREERNLNPDVVFDAVADAFEDGWALKLSYIDPKSKVRDHYCDFFKIKDEDDAYRAILRMIAKFNESYPGIIYSKEWRTYNLPPVTEPTPPNENGTVNHPSHYNQGGIECIDAIQASMSTEGFLDFCKGNVMKYIWRYWDKNGVEDLKKAMWYLNKMIETFEKEEESDE